MQLTDYHSKYFAHELTRRCPPESVDKFAAALAGAKVDWVINQTYNAAMLAEALCNLEGFPYAPSDSIYWQHGRSTERDFIYITTVNLNHEQLKQVSEEVGPERSLLGLRTVFRGKGEYASLTVKKSRRQVLSRCEWGHGDFSLRVENLPQKPPKPGQQDLGLD